MFLQHLPPHDRAIDVALLVDADSFRAAVLFGGRFHILDEVLHGAVLSAADADAFLPAGLVFAPGFGIGNIHGVVLRDEDAAGAAPLHPRVEVFAVLIEDLDAVVVTIADEDAALRIES